MKNYLAMYTIYYADNKFQKMAGINNFISDKEKFYQSWHQTLKEDFRFESANDKTAKERANYKMELLIDGLTRIDVIDITLDELLEVRNINVNDIKRRESSKVISEEKLGLSALAKYKISD